MDKVEIRQLQSTKAVSSNLPKTAEDRALALVDLFERLTNHLAGETEMIEARKTGDLSDLVKAKQPISLVTEEMARLLRIDREGMAGLPLELKERLRDSVRSLQAAVDANIGSLERAVGAQRLLVDTVVHAVNRDRTFHRPSYGPMAGGRRSNTPARANRAFEQGPNTSITLNTCL